MKRYLAPLEMLSSHCLPMTAKQAKKSHARRLVVDSVKASSLVKMSGNGMNLMSIGAILLACVLSLEPKKRGQTTS